MFQRKEKPLKTLCQIVIFVNSAPRNECQSVKFNRNIFICMFVCLCAGVCSWVGVRENICRLRCVSCIWAILITSSSPVIKKLTISDQVENFPLCSVCKCNSYWNEKMTKKNVDISIHFVKTMALCEHFPGVMQAFGNDTRKYKPHLLKWNATHL